MGEVVVGVDGSRQSFAALRLAAREARWRSSRLQVVYVYEPFQSQEAHAVAAVTASAAWMSAARSSEMLREAYHHSDVGRNEAQRHADARVRTFLHEVGDGLDGVDVQTSAIADTRPAVALLYASTGADLLVVGSRGLGGFRGLLLGSVSQQCVQHAACAVLVARTVRG